MTQTENPVSAVNKTVLENGLTVISEHIPAYRSIAVGAWIKSGSRFEKPHEKGIAHFIEHMLFRGTQKRSALKIARSLEELGGTLNAFTGKEEICFYVHILDAHLRISVDVLGDMICRPLFREKDIEKEKQVVLEEISAVKDTPEEYIFDIFQEQLFPGQALGYPILGEAESLKRFSRDDVFSFWERYFTPENMVITAAGNVHHFSLVKLVERYFDFVKRDSLPSEPDKAHMAQGVHVNLRQPLNQSHVCLGSEGTAYDDDRRFDLIAINNYLGGGMSSRLFQSIRERLGLAYSVYSFLDFYKDTGVLGFYLGTDARNESRARNKLVEELNLLRKKPLSAKAVHKIKEQIKGGMILALENAPRRMTRLAKNEMFFGRHLSVDELMGAIDSVTSESMYDTAKRFVEPDKLSSVKISPTG